VKAVVWHGDEDVRVESVPDARLKDPADALLTITRACICGSDLWPYKTMERTEEGQRMGHEFIGIVEAVGKEVRTVKRGDLVVAPFAWSACAAAFPPVPQPAVSTAAASARATPESGRRKGTTPAARCRWFPAVRSPRRVSDRS